MRQAYQKRFILPLLFIFIFPLTGYGADLKVELSADKVEVGLDDYLRLSIKVSSDSISSMPDAEVTGIEEFEVAGTSSSSQVTILNLSMQRSYTTTYTLKPKSSGKTVTLKASVKSGSKTFLSNAVDVKLVKSTASKRQNRQSQPFARNPLRGFGNNPFSLFNQGRQREYKRGDFILQATLSSPEVFVGEELVYTLSFYRAFQIMSRINYNFPETKGFWREDVPEEKRETVSNETMAGREYLVVKIPLLLYPLTDGTLELGKGKIAFQPDAFSGKLTLESNDFKIKVLPLPEEGKPADFAGLVGDYSIKSKIDKREVLAGKPLTLEITVKGRGNVHAIAEPARPDLSKFEIYEPELFETITKNYNGSDATKGYKYIIIPEEEGKIEIGSFSINWFDPKAKKYREAKTKKITINVLPSKNAKKIATKNTLSSNQTAKEIMEPKEKGHFSFSLAGLFLIALAVFMLKLFGPKKIEETDIKEELSPSQQAKESLASADNFLILNDADRFYMEIDKALRGLICEKENIPKEVSITEALKEKLGEGDDTILRTALELFNKSETVRYGPVIASKEEMKTALKSAREVLEVLGNE